MAPTFTTADLAPGSGDKKLDRDDPGPGNAPAGPDPTEEVGPANEPEPSEDDGEGT